MGAFTDLIPAAPKKDAANSFADLLPARPAGTPYTYAEAEKRYPGGIVNGRPRPGLADTLNLREPTDAAAEQELTDNILATWRNNQQFADVPQAAREQRARAAASDIIAKRTKRNKGRFRTFEEAEAAAKRQQEAQQAEKQQFEAGRAWTPKGLLRRALTAHAFVASLPVRMATHGQYGLADAAEQLPGMTLATALRRAEEDFVRANRNELETLAQIGEATMGVPQLAELGAVPGQVLRTVGAGTRQTGRLLRDVVAPTAQTGRLGATAELGASIAETVPGVPYITRARRPNALANIAEEGLPAEETFTTPRSALQKFVGGVRDVKEGLSEHIPGLRSSRDARLFRMLERQGQTPEQALAYLEKGQETAKFGRGRAALPETIGDTGPASRRMVRTIEMMPGEAASQAETFLRMRQRGTPIGTAKSRSMAGQFERVNEDLKRSLKVTRDDFAKTKEGLIKQQQENSAPLYEQFRNMKNAKGEPVLIDVGQVLRASEEADADLSRSLKNVMKKAREEFMDEVIARDVTPGLNQEVRLGKDAIAARAPTARLSPARFDNAKRALDDMIEAAQGRGLTFQVSLLTDLKNKLVAVADKASMRPVTQKQKVTAFNERGQPYELTVETPVSDASGRATRESIYAKARDAYSSPAAMKDALQLGRTFMKGDSEVTAAQYKALTTAEKRMFRVGMAKQAEIDLGSKTRGSDMVRYFDRPNVEKVMSEIMTPAQLQKFQELMRREGGMLASYRAIQGSRTTPGLEDVADFDWMTRVAKSMSTKGPVGATMEFAGNIVTAMTRMREKDALAVAEVLFETNPAKQREILVGLQRKYGQSRLKVAYQAVADQAERVAAAATQENRGRVTDAMIDLATRARGALPPGSQAMPGLQERLQRNKGQIQAP